MGMLIPEEVEVEEGQILIGLEVLLAVEKLSHF
jgi:hypothetical protein